MIEVKITGIKISYHEIEVLGEQASRYLTASLEAEATFRAEGMSSTGTMQLTEEERRACEVLLRQIEQRVASELCR